MSDPMFGLRYPFWDRVGPFWALKKASSEPPKTVPTPTGHADCDERRVSGTVFATAGPTWALYTPYRVQFGPEIAPNHRKGYPAPLGGTPRRMR